MENDKKQGRQRKKQHSDVTQQEVREQGLTYSDYAALDDDNRYELVDGRLELMSPAPQVVHQLISIELQSMLRDTCLSDYIILNAPVDLILSSRDVRQPDLLMVHRNRIHIISQKGVTGPPDIVVEILSPSTLRRDKVDKRKTYANYGVQEYWMIEPILGTLEQFVLTEDRYELVNVYQGDESVHSPHVMCVRFSMAEIMANIPDIKN